MTIHNNGKTPLRNVEFDYPGAAFGTASISAGGSYWYHIKPTQDGDMTLSFERANGSTFKQREGTLHANDSGKLTILVEENGGRVSVLIGLNGEAGKK